THAEPTKAQGKQNCENYSARARLSCPELRIFVKKSSRSNDRQAQENKAGDLEPELAEHAAELAGRDPTRSNQRTYAAIAARLLCRYSRENTQFPGLRGNVRH